MPNIASLLKVEITRIARKEVKAQADATRKSSSLHRAEIATLKRRVQELERVVDRLRRQSRALPIEPEVDETRTASRFSAKGLASHRRRLGLSAEDYGKLVGASSLSIYKWEGGKTRPQARFMDALLAVRGLGKKEVAERLSAA